VNVNKKIFSIWSVLLILVVSIAVVVPGCGGGATYDLTMAVAPPGSGTATDLTGGSPYARDAAVDITAAALGSYQFCEWTTTGGTLADPNAATTTFTMPAQNVTVTANFVGPLDHFKCYNVTDATSLEKSVSLKDQFIELDATVKEAAFFGNPTDKAYYQEETLISNADHHLTVYWITHEEYGRYWNVEVTNQFDDEPQYLTVGGPVALAVPTQKLEPGGHEEPKCLDHYLVYAVVNDVFIEDYADLKDEFGNDVDAGVGEAVFFANPVQKTVGSEVTEITTDEHLVFYKLYFTEAPCPSQVDVDNQFGPQTLYLGDPATLLGVPSEKVAFGEQLDHFLSYPVTEEPEYVGQNVTLDDQLLVESILAEVWHSYDFINPAAKTLTESWPPIVHPDYHLTWYDIHYDNGGSWFVTVENQFGKQELVVSGPIGLLVPTWKKSPGVHEPPVGLDHFLVYGVVPGDPVEPIPVWVRDQFSPPSGGLVGVADPIYFAVPAEKTVGFDVTYITNPLTHLVFYDILGAEWPCPSVLVEDQFHEHTPILGASAYMLGVPSLKLSAEPIQ